MVMVMVGRSDAAGADSNAAAAGFFSPLLLLLFCCVQVHVIMDCDRAAMYLLDEETGETWTRIGNRVS